MEKTLEHHLEEGEQIRWQARPAPFPLLDSVYRVPLTRKWILCAAAALVLSLAYVLVTVRSGVELKLIVPVITIAIPAFVALEPLLHYRQFQRSVVYGITNKRAIVCVGSAKHLELELGAVDAVQLTDDEKENGTLCIGSGTVGMKPARLRLGALFGVNLNNTEEEKRGIVFYCVNRRELETAAAMLTDLCPTHAAAEAPKS